MAKNKFDAFDSMFGTPVKETRENSTKESLVEPSVPESADTNEEEPKKLTTRACYVVSVEQNNKIKAIAEAKNIDIKDVVSIAFGMLIERYERVNGKVDPTPKKKKGNPEDIFK